MPGATELGIGIDGDEHETELPAANDDFGHHANRRSAVVIVASVDRYSPIRNAPAAVPPMFAFLSHWDAGLIILDVGNGIAGGSPASPVEVSRIKTVGGQTHNAWYWPAAGYVFVGEENFGRPEARLVR